MTSIRFSNVVRWFLLMAALWLWGCFEVSGDKSAPENGTQGLPEVGDKVAPKDSTDPVGTVVDVKSIGDGCYQVRIDYDPIWTCSADQLDEVGGLSSSAEDGIAYDDYIPAIDTDSSALPVDIEMPANLAVTSCADLAKLRRPVVKGRYLQEISNQRRSILQDKCLEKTVYQYLDETGHENSDCQTQWEKGVEPAAAVFDYDDGAGGASVYSTTNNQVAGVEEADFVKNNDQYIYVARPDGLHVIDAWPAADTREVGFAPIDGEPIKLLLYGDQVVVFVNAVEQGSQVDPMWDYRTNMGNTECTYGYGCRYSAQPGPLRIMVFDVSDATAPRQIHQTELSGGYVTARRIGQYVYTVVLDGGVVGLPGVSTNLASDSPAALEEVYQNRVDDAVDAVAQAPDAYFLPWVINGSDDPGGAACNNALVAKAASGETFLSVISLNLERPDSLNTTMVATRAGFVYASANAIYVATDGADSSDYYDNHMAPNMDISTIHKFNLLDGATRYAGSHLVSGHVLNQFSMDEQAGVLRVATTNGWVPNADVSSNITTLEEQNGDLVIVGSLTGLAPNEDIRSVRFDGDRGFVVTFKKTDPLFVLNLQDPAMPSVLGELKIPGFSTYMHMLDENHILAVGFDARDQGSFAYFDGIQVQIFDVTDLTNPTLLHKMVIGTRGSGSEALTNHLAFNYFAPLGVLALPVTVCEGGDANQGMYGETLTFSGLLALDISVSDGITERGRMPFIDPAQTVGTDCNVWWTDTTSLVKRSIFMEDYLYGLSDDLLNVANLGQLDQPLASVDL